MPSGPVRTKALVLAVAATALTAGPSTPVGAGETVEVTISGYRFSPAEVQIRVGDTVRWVSREKRASHSVFFEAESLPESNRLFTDDTWARQFTAPGRYPYHCGPHPEMQGLVIVD